VQCAGGLERPLEREDHLPVGLGAAAGGLGEGLSRHGRRRTVDVTAANELLDQGSRAAGSSEVLGEPAPGGREVRQHGRPSRDGGKVVEA
jgi:hypothetical protein